MFLKIKYLYKMQKAHKSLFLLLSRKLNEDTESVPCCGLVSTCPS